MNFRIFQYLGIVLIILFSALSIFLSTSARDLNPDGDNIFLINYSSFFEDRFFDLRMNIALDKETKAREKKEKEQSANNIAKQSEEEFLIKADQHIVLAAIDDQSLLKLGRWPWSRKTIVQLINKLNHFGAKVVAFDVFFSEPEVSCNAESPDQLFAETIKKFQATPGSKIILPYSAEIRNVLVNKDGVEANIDENIYFKEVPDQLLNFMLDTRQAEGSELQKNIVEKKVYPIEILANSEAGLAHIEANSDPDGVFRNYRIVANIDSLYLPSFGLMAYEYFSGDKPRLNIPSADTSYLQIKSGNLFLNSLGEAKVRWYGSQAQFPTISVLKILNSDPNDEALKINLKDKLVFVGSTAYGAHDFRNTPVDSMLPGVVFHMNFVQMLLDGKFIVASDKISKASYLMLIVGSLLMIGIMFFGNAILDFFTVFSIMAGLFYLDTYYYIPKGYNNRLFFCLFSVLSCYSWSTFLHFYQSNKEKKKIRGTFSRYLAPSIVNDLLKNPEKVKLGGEKKNITVFFSDVRDFTSISEKLTPEQLSNCLNKYMTMMTDTLFEHNGTLDKYIGDAMVAYWGAPVDLQNHSYWAIKGALEMIERLPAINEEFEKEGFPQFKHGIGLNTGDCSVGNMGSNQIFSYTALGDNMNLGARLESLCKFYGVQLNISEYTKNSIPLELQKEFVFRTLDKVKVKGKEKPVTIYEVLHPTHPLYKELDAISDYESAFQLYLQFQFEKAFDVIRSLHKRFPEDPTFERMMQTCKEFKETPPGHDWDGSYTHKSK